MIVKDRFKNHPLKWLSYRLDSLVGEQKRIAWLLLHRHLAKQFQYYDHYLCHYEDLLGERCYTITVNPEDYWEFDEGDNWDWHPSWYGVPMDMTFCTHHWSIINSLHRGYV